MAWGKVLKISIGDPANPFTAEFNATDLPDLDPLTLTEADNVTDEGTAVDLSGLTVGFRVTRSNVFKDNKAELNIANVSDATARRFISAENSYITIEAGYSDEGTGMIFSGYITSAMTEWQGADRLLHIVAQTIRAKGYAEKDNKGLSMEIVEGRERRKVMTKTFMAMSYGPGAKVLDIAKALSANLGVTLNVFNESTVATFIRPNGYNFVGRASHVVNDLRDFLIAEGYDFTMDLSTMIIFKIYDTGSVLEIPALTYESGLLKVGPVQAYETDPRQVESLPPSDTWELETLLDARLAPNGIVQVKSDQLEGYFLIENVQYHGDSDGGEFNCTMVVSRQ